MAAAVEWDELAGVVEFLAYAVPIRVQARAQNLINPNRHRCSVPKR